MLQFLTDITDVVTTAQWEQRSQPFLSNGHVFHHYMWRPRIASVPARNSAERAASQAGRVSLGGIGCLSFESITLACRLISKSPANSCPHNLYNPLLSFFLSLPLSLIFFLSLALSFASR
jgi:hypothetical protein